MSGAFYLNSVAVGFFFNLPVNTRHMVLFAKSAGGLFKEYETEKKTEQSPSCNNKKEDIRLDQCQDSEKKNSANITVGAGHTANLTGKASLDHRYDGEGGTLRSLHKHRTGNGQYHSEGNGPS